MTTDHRRPDWFDFGARRQLVEEGAAFLDADEKVETRSGLEFWFRPPAGQQPAKCYKQFLLTLSVIYLLTMLAPAVLHRLLGPLSLLSNYWVGHLIASAVIVGLMVYLVMPRYTRLMARWLYE